jgi:hypothetical protein
LSNRLRIVADGLTVKTTNLSTLGSTLGQVELALTVRDSQCFPAVMEILTFIGKYVLDSGRRIVGGQTVACGFWLLRFEDRGGMLEASELTEDGSGFTPGVDLAARYWSEQHALCSAHMAEFQPPLGDRLVVLSPGVLEGDVVQGVRYPSPEHMSGWWITTARYNGDVKSLKTEHLYHLTAARPDLARYLALPYGFRFDTGPDVPDVWFDLDTAKG